MNLNQNDAVLDQLKKELTLFEQAFKNGSSQDTVVCLFQFVYIYIFDVLGQSFLDEQNTVDAYLKFIISRWSHNGKSVPYVANTDSVSPVTDLQWSNVHCDFFVRVMLPKLVAAILQRKRYLFTAHALTHFLP
jgi:hypothetical protein